MKKYLIATLLFFCSYQLRAQSALKPVIGWDSLNNYILNKISFPDSLVTGHHGIIAQFTIEQSKKGKVKKVTLVSSIPANAPGTEQISAILMNEIFWNIVPGENEVTLIILKYTAPETITLISGTDTIKNFEVIGENPFTGTRTAEFPGGMNAFVRFIIDNLNYPPRCQENNLNGSVLLSFFVNTNGAVSNVEIIKDESKQCPEYAVEVIRVLQESPPWIPAANSKGQLVKAQRTLPVQMTISNH